jgi:DNA polymerase-3 subunit delta
MALKRGQEEGLYGAKLANVAQVPPYFLDQYLEQTKVWTLRHLEKSLAVLAETDKALKSSPLSSHIWLENMILRLSMTNMGSPRVSAAISR